VIIYLGLVLPLNSGELPYQESSKTYLRTSRLLLLLGKDLAVSPLLLQVSSLFAPLGSLPTGITRYLFNFLWEVGVRTFLSRYTGVITRLTRTITP